MPDPKRHRVRITLRLFENLMASIGSCKTRLHAELCVYDYEPAGQLSVGSADAETLGVVRGRSILQLRAFVKGKAKGFVMDFYVWQAYV
jgi:hypothetical protein